MTDILQEPAVLNLTAKLGDDISFDIVANMDLTTYTYGASITPMTVVGNTDIPIVITVNDITVGGLHFFISKESTIDLPILIDKHKWNFWWSVGGFKRTILGGYFNIKGV